VATIPPQNWNRARFEIGVAIGANPRVWLKKIKAHAARRLILLSCDASRKAKYLVPRGAAARNVVAISSPRYIRLDSVMTTPTSNMGKRRWELSLCIGGSLGLVPVLAGIILFGTSPGTVLSRFTYFFFVLGLPAFY
jgi:hypothetical protein